MSSTKTIASELRALNDDELEAKLIFAQEELFKAKIGNKRAADRQTVMKLTKGNLKRCRRIIHERLMHRVHEKYANVPDCKKPKYLRVKTTKRERMNLTKEEKKIQTRKSFNRQRK